MEDHQQRFQAVRFTVHGDAYDQRESVCTELACPHCHLPVPRIMLSHKPLFVSILGSPSCGKSYFLGAVANGLRRVLPSNYALDFSDADHVSNDLLNQYEQSLFMQPNPDQPLALNNLIPKTEVTGQWYNRVTRGTQEVFYPKPFSFLLRPLEQHSNANHADRLARSVCLYDNAGEHFLPGYDKTSTPTTRHLAVSDFVMFLFDPLQDPRFVNELSTHDTTGRYQRQIERFSKPVRQEQVLRECAARMAKYRREASGDDTPPLIVVATKCDEWMHLLPDFNAQMQVERSQGDRALHVQNIQENSEQLEQLFKRLVPELTVAADAFSDQVTYLPSSALGIQPDLNDDGIATIKPRDLKPKFVELSFLYGVSMVTRGLVRTHDAD